MLLCCVGCGSSQHTIELFSAAEGATEKGPVHLTAAAAAILASSAQPVKHRTSVALLAGCDRRPCISGRSDRQSAKVASLCLKRHTQGREPQLT